MLNKILLRPQVLRDVSSVTTKTILFDRELDLPVYIAPTSAAKTGGAEGELTLALDVAAGAIVRCFATPSSNPYDNILGKTPKQAMFQLYVNKDRTKSEAVVWQMTAFGKIMAILVTVDVPVVPKGETDERVRSSETLSLAGIQVEVKGSDKKGGAISRQASHFIDSSIDWSVVNWPRRLTPAPIMVKGIQTTRHAKISHGIGCDGIAVSNYGGRVACIAPPAILVLLELLINCPEVLESMEILIDGGSRRGADVVKAIGLGASPVRIDRICFYSLGNGQRGVKHVASSESRPIN